MKKIDYEGRTYGISSHSGGADPNSCVAVARPDETAVTYAVKDSTNMSLPGLCFSRAEWRAFLSTLKD